MAQVKTSTPKRVLPKKKVKPEAAEDDGQGDNTEEDSQEESEEEDDSDDSEASESDDNSGEESEDGEESADEDDFEAEDGESLGDDTTADDGQATNDTAEPVTPVPGSATLAAKAPEQLGFAKRVGRESTKPVPTPSMTRPYLDSPREFGIHIKGHLVRFRKGRTPITEQHFKHHELDVEEVLTALRTDTYVADNGAELVE